MDKKEGLGLILGGGVGAESMGESGFLRSQSSENLMGMENGEQQHSVSFQP